MIGAGNRAEPVPTAVEPHSSLIVFDPDYYESQNADRQGSVSTALQIAQSLRVAGRVRAFAKRGLGHSGHDEIGCPAPRAFATLRLYMGTPATWPVQWTPVTEGLPGSTGNEALVAFCSVDNNEGRAPYGNGPAGKNL